MVKCKARHMTKRLVRALLLSSVVLVFLIKCCYTASEQSFIFCHGCNVLL